MDVDRLFDLDQRAVETVRKFPKHRLQHEALSRYVGRPFVAMVGPRGAGKTILLRQLRSDQEASIYLSADTLGRNTSLIGVIQRFHDAYGIRNFYIDEIHFAAGFPAALKEGFDFYDIGLWFTSSSALALHDSAWDLSRRVLRIPVGPFSYREYLWFSGEPLLEPLTLNAALFERIPDPHLRGGAGLRDYLSGGLYPFTLEAPAEPQIFRNMLEKVIATDVTAADPAISMAELDEMRGMIEFIGRSPVDGINYSTVADNLKITKYKVRKYMDLLERSFLLSRTFPHGTNVLKEPKVFLELPYRLAYKPYEECIGALREDYASLTFRQHGVSFEYAKSSRGGKTPDFVLAVAGETVVVEVGGPGKGRTRFKELSYDRKVVVYHGGKKTPRPSEAVPLHTLGFPTIGSPDPGPA
jgi:predicted AAA+ superfamily ATPase